MVKKQWQQQTREEHRMAISIMEKQDTAQAKGETGWKEHQTKINMPTDYQMLPVPREKLLDGFQGKGEIPKYHSYMVAG